MKMALIESYLLTFPCGTAVGTMRLVSVLMGTPCSSTQTTTSEA
jgi:hypothetical protein